MTIGRRPVLFALLPFAFTTSVAALDAPTVSSVAQGFGKSVLTVTAGESGAPDGFSVWWMKQSNFAANGNQMTYYPSPIQGVAVFTGEPTLNTWDGTVTSFVLAPNQSLKVEIGDLDDETGAWTNLVGELEPGTAYVFCVSANAPGDTYYPASDYSANQFNYTQGGQDCTYTQGFWKNHEEAWPVSSLTLGNVLYTKAQLLAIFGQPVQGNGLISLAHQLIATKLNIANGSNPATVAATIASADAFIANRVIPPVGGDSVPPGQTSSMTQVLDDYNNGVIGPGHCAPVSVDAVSWSQIKGLYR